MIELANDQGNEMKIGNQTSCKTYRPSRDL